MAQATIRDVAREAAVSVASVSRVLSGGANVRPALRHRVVEAIARLGYVPHAGARMLSRAARTDTIGVILPDMHGEFFSELLRGMDVEASGRGLQLLLSTMHADANRGGVALRSMRGRVDGVVVMAPQIDPDILFSHLPPGVSAVLVNCAPHHEPRAELRVDNEAGAGEMTRHLLALGRRRIVHVAGPAGNVDADGRVRGYEAAMAAAGLPTRVLPGNFREEAGAAAVATLLHDIDQVDAIFAANDQMAIGALIALRDAGVDVPRQIAIGGFDDVPLARLVSPGITTMSADAYALGRRAVERVGGLIAEAPDAGLEWRRPLLVVRGSTVSHQESPKNGLEQGERS
ncbi:LacI family DNA-binding transcriptional regulator [Sphingomonas rubra]|uniref:Transcriptional regulator, LacI family n=1 Tax=Sphingomonas rubra TaxID=634430 RepID=A0A1I5QYF0_9SPHN|nr:LacI family DNA-binding transcriptional regulator [Sphingomonas rubra]SFP51282.1 transcriptional regulator, LacI family [Sphingomonas rubra]